jgi:hypothetical protein
MDARTSGVLAVAAVFAAVVGGCSGEEKPAAPAATEAVSQSGRSIAGGTYRATTPGEMSTIDFYDENHYFLRRASCPESDESCVVHGTYHVDASGKTLTLQDDGVASAETLKLEGFEPGSPVLAGGPGLTAPQAVHPLVAPPLYGTGTPLMTKYGCKILDQIYLGGQSMEEGADNFFSYALTHQANKPGNIPGNPDWVNDQVAKAKAECAGPWRNATEAALDQNRIVASPVTWEGVALIAIPSCYDGNPGSVLNYSYYLGDQTKVAEWEYRPDGSRWFIPLQPPSTVRQIARDECTKQAAPSAPAPN